MRIAYLDCFAGISGDMFLGALLDAGVPAEVLHDAVRTLNIGATLRIGRADRSGINAARVRVLEHGQPAEGAEHPGPEEAVAANTPQAIAEQHTHHVQQQPRTQHLHKMGHVQDHSHAEESAAHEAVPHAHGHGRSLSVIRQLIRSAQLAEPVKNFAIHTFELLGASESKIHDVPIDDIHFHEVGAVDAIVDIVAAGAGIHALNMEAISETGAPLRWHCSALNVGGGMVQCAHGTFPVPAPATADLLRGAPTYAAHLQKELVTPTGAAIVRALAPEFGLQPAMRVARIGYGAGTRNPTNFPNVLRLSVGETGATTEPRMVSHGAGAELNVNGSRSAQEDLDPKETSFGGTSHIHDAHTDSVTVLETALDDLNPQILAHVTEQALALGAFDVMTTAVGMKKGRAGTLLTILADEDHSPALERLLLRETSTLGIRVHQQRRICLARRHTAVTTRYGVIRIKIGTFDGEAINAAPEFEDCRSAALACCVPVKLVIQSAIAAYALSDSPERADHTEGQNASV